MHSSREAVRKEGDRDEEEEKVFGSPPAPLEVNGEGDTRRRRLPPLAVLCGALSMFGIACQRRERLLLVL